MIARHIGSLGVLAAFITIVAPGRLAAQRQAAPRHEGYVSAGPQVRLYYRLTGSGPDTVVVIHGGPGLSSAYLAPDLAPLARHHTLLFYDQRGAGRSTLVSDSASLTGAHFADDLEAIRRHFRFARMTVLAHSWGAAVVGLYAMRHPDRLGRVVIVDGIAVTRAGFLRAARAMRAQRDSVTLAALDRLHAARMADPGDTRACRLYYGIWFRIFFVDTAALHRSRGDFCGDSPASRANKLRAVDRYLIPSLGDWDWRGGLGQVRSPVLVIHGAGDLNPVSNGRAWAAAARDGRLLVIDQAGHFPYLERPDAFFAALETFLDGRWPSGAAVVTAP